MDKDIKKDSIHQFVSLRLVPESPKVASGIVARENQFQHQLPNPGLLLRGHDLFKMLFGCPLESHTWTRLIIKNRATLKEYYNKQSFLSVDQIKYHTLMRRIAWLRLERWFSLVEAVVRLRLAGTKCLSKSEKEEIVVWVRPGMRMFLSLSSLIGRSWELGDRRSST